MPKNQLTSTEEYIWSYINQHFDEVAHLTISELSDLLCVSNASITRTLKKKNYSGFSSFKHDLENQKKENLSVLENKSLTKDTKQSIIKNYQEVIRTLNMLDVETIERIIPLLHEANRIVIFARGFSELIASEMLVKFQLSNKHCEMYNDPNIIRPISQRLDAQQDLALFISLNGETKALVEAAQNCIKHHIPSVLISANQSGSLAKIISLRLFGFKTELSYFPDFEVHSRLPLSIISRILLDTYAAKYKNDNHSSGGYHLFHTAGNKRN